MSKGDAKGRKCETTYKTASYLWLSVGLTCQNEDRVVTVAWPSGRPTRPGLPPLVPEAVGAEVVEALVQVVDPLGEFLAHDSSVCEVPGGVKPICPSNFRCVLIRGAPTSCLSVRRSGSVEAPSRSGIPSTAWRAPRSWGSEDG